MDIPFKKIEKLSGVDNLNEENFFNNLAEHYPRAMQQFSNWIGNYILETRWGKLFSHLEDCKHKSELPEFYEIPFEMQMGIIIHFFREVANDNTCPNLLNYLPINELVDNFELYIIRAFHRLESTISMNIWLKNNSRLSHKTIKRKSP